MVRLLRSRTSAPAGTPQVRWRLRISQGALVAIGPGKVELLEAIQAQGSISAAAKQLDMSYRRAWVLLDEINRSLRQPAVASAQGGEHGGGSALTPVGEEIVRRYRAIEARAATACAADLRALLRLLA